MAHLTPVVLSGGSGSRLWPLSRKLKPKQLLALVDEHTMLQETLLRTRALAASVDTPIIVCNQQQRFLVAEQSLAIGGSSLIAVEPSARNTAPAVAAAALLALARAPASDEPLLLVLPADHVIRDAAAFRAAVEAAAEAASNGLLVTFGVVPTRPETGYGYLLRGADRGRWSLLERFVEKPDFETAAAYVASGRHFWNSGMFVLPARLYLSELGRHAPRMLDACRRAVEGAQADRDFTWLGSAFLECPSDSIDYAVMEKTDRAAVVPLDAGWSDVGSWAALHEILAKDADGNATRGDVMLEDCRDSCVVSTSRLVTAVGLDGFVVIETADAVAVLPKRDSQRIKRIVERLEKAERTEIRDIPSPADEEK